MSQDPRAVEVALAAYYDEEAKARAQRPLGNRRIVARRRFLSMIPPTSLPLLEVGTGPGRDTKGLAGGGLPIIGVDISWEMSQRARAAGSHQAVATVRQLPFRDSSFGALWTMSTLMHVPNSAIAATMAELRRVLAPGALAAVGVWGGPDVEEDHVSSGESPRFFSRRSDETWRSLLTNLGEIERFDTWRWDGEQLWYQWALVLVS